MANSKSAPAILETSGGVANTFVKKELAMSKVSARPFPVNACNSIRMPLETAKVIVARDGAAIDRDENLTLDQQIDLAHAWRVVRREQTEDEFRNCCSDVPTPT
jgi:hypothetical protein